MSQIALCTYKLEGVYAGGLPEAPPIFYDPAHHLPPDAASESLAGYDGQQVLRQAADRVDFNPNAPFRVLIPGIGVGTLACAFLAHEQKLQTLGTTPIHIDGFDINTSAIDQARQNLSGYIAPRFSHNVYQADWNQAETWKALPPNSYDLILCNLPYLPVAEAAAIRPSYASVPDTATAGGTDGLDHFRQILPQLPPLMNHRRGGTVLFRFRTPGLEQTVTLNNICTAVFGKLAWPSGLFPTEGMASGQPDADGRQRWLSYGRIVLPPKSSPTAPLLFKS